MACAIKCLHMHIIVTELTFLLEPVLGTQLSSRGSAEGNQWYGSCRCRWDQTVCLRLVVCQGKVQPRRMLSSRPHVLARAAEMFDAPSWLRAVMEESADWRRLVSRMLDVIGCRSQLDD